MHVARCCRHLAVALTAWFVLAAVGGFPARAADTDVSLVPWRVLDPGTHPPKTAFTLFWIPVSPAEMRHSGLITSRRLLFYSGRCVGMQVVRPDDRDRLAKLSAGAAPLAIFVEGEKEIARLATDAASEVEAMVRQAIDTREASLNAVLDDASSKAAAGDRDTAIDLYRSVAAQDCAYPRLAKTAQRALKRLGVKR